MLNFRSIWTIALCTASLSAACAQSHSLECNAACVADVKRETASYRPFAGATEEQWQTAFDTATGELAKGDWAQPLSEIQQEFCRTPGKVDSAKVRDLENDIFKKLAHEASNTHIDINAALSQPESASGAKALAQMRAEGMKQAILKTKVREFMVSCYAPPSANAGAH